MSKILIIEDEEFIVESITEYLESEGYNCITATNGIDGIQNAKEQKPDLIVCDVKMPGLNGHQVLQELRSDPRTSTIPFIFLSAMVHKNDLRRGMILGADDYLTKPFQPEDLLNSVKTRLEKYSELHKKVDKLKDSVALALPHELQTPLVAIIGYAEILTQKFKESPDNEALEFSEAILQAGLRLNRLIKNFIFYEKLELMKDDLQLTGLSENYNNISLNIVNNVANKVAKKFNRMSDLVTTVEDGIVKIPITHLNSLLEELIDNAFKFSQPGAPVIINCKNEGDHYSIDVFDNGRGMTEEQIANVSAYLQFEREKYEQQGMGLGLTISTKIVEIFGGKINIKSIYGESTEVNVLLPSKL